MNRPRGAKQYYAEQQLSLINERIADVLRSQLMNSEWIHPQIFAQTLVNIQAEIDTVILDLCCVN